MAELRSLFIKFKAFAGALSDRGLATYAASCAFYSFLSLFPMTALAASLVPCVGVDEAALLHFLDGFAPASVAVVLKVILSNVFENVFPALPLSLMALLWSAAQSFAELLKGMAVIAQSRGTSFLRRRLRAILLTLALLATLILSLWVLVFGEKIAFLLKSLYPDITELLGFLLRVRYLIVALLLWLLFAFLYRSIPGRQLSFREVRAVAALIAAAWIVFSALFSLYASRFLDLTLYGGMAAMALTMLWLFYCQYIVLAGAGLCAEWHAKKEAVPARTAS